MSLPDRIYAELRSQILNHELTPASSLKIDGLSERLRASTIPVREALARLCAEGLVVQENRQGFTVRPVTPKLLEDDYRTLATILQVGAGEAATGLAKGISENESDADLAKIVNSDSAESLDEFLFSWLPSKRLAGVGAFCLSHCRYFFKLDFEIRGEEGLRHFVRRRQRAAAALQAGKGILAQKLIAEECDWRIQNIPLVIREMLFRQLMP
jgi:DNA-binding transcriptional MocR family regulator